jgi:hypothetical protein
VVVLVLVCELPDVAEQVRDAVRAVACTPSAIPSFLQKARAMTSRLLTV